MERTNDLFDPKKKKQDSSSHAAPQKNDSDDASGYLSPTDSRADEKVIVNEQRANKTVNTPSQTGSYTSESNSYDDEIIDSSGI